MRFAKNNNAVSPIVAAILLMAIMVGAISVLYSVGAPLVTDFQDRATINNITNEMICSLFNFFSNSAMATADV